MQQTIVVDPTIELPEALIALLEDVDNEKAQRWFRTLGWELANIRKRDANFHAEGCAWPKKEKRLLVHQYLIFVFNALRQEYLPTIAKCPSCGAEVSLENYYGW